ncbi:PucR family transcriptional regulator [Treponema primitia]|uniref:PucR family transcriptional regulator n=1 Tax=Treponema primitia TaxID=88058 RepID=UPI000255575C|nr:PucR family transcriptional regulator ligand-binding domain-containing protein [Treponema primitia]
MSVTVADLMALPSLREAKVLAGRQGLQKTVTTMSVLEYTRTDTTQEYMLNAIEFLGSEIVITCFADVPDDVEAQCVNMRRLSDVGMVGLILYYVGIIMPRVDTKLIALADSLDFPLICMPENRPNLRYSEVITEIMNAVFKDQQTETHYQAEILERISRLPVYQRSIGTAMRMLSDRLRLSLLLTDAAGQLLNNVYWPRTRELDAERTIADFDGLASGELTKEQLCISRHPVRTASGSRLDLYILRQDEAVSDEDAAQITDVLRICINLLSEKHGEQVLPELVQAILQDEPLKMRRIADVFKIDVASIHNMWIITPPEGTEDSIQQRRTPQVLLSLIRTELSPYCKTIIADIHNQDVVAFMDNPVDCDISLLAASLSAAMKGAGINALLTVCLNLTETTQVRRAYLQNKKALGTAQQIYPWKRVFTQREIAFAETCQNIMAGGEGRVKECIAVLDCLNSDDERQTNDSYETLTVFLLDAESSQDKCAELLLFHRNTIKYRINHINERMGFKIGHMPETMELYTAVALRRILQARVKIG